MERVQGDSWRSQSLEALHGCPLLHKEYKDLVVIIRNKNYWKAADLSQS
jgi:hypothetical protein